MDNNPFYVYDTHDCVWTSNPEFKNLTEWFVWDPHTWWEYAYALSQGVEFFPNAEIYRGVRPPGPGEIDFGNDKRKKVAILFYEHVRRHLASGQVSDSGPIEDYPNEIVNTALNWADIVITYSTEPLQNWWPRIYGDINYAVHHDKIKCVFASHMPYTDPPPDRFYTDQLSFFSMVATANQYKDITEVTVPFRKYMFDILMGTVKTSRLYLMYRLLESDFMDQCLINLQPSPHGDDVSRLRTVDPQGFKTHGLIQRFQSPALADLEEPVIAKFKEQTKDLDARGQYSVNLVHRPDFGVPGDNVSMSCIVPWGVYQSSWYSVVCETADFGNVTFLSEKTAKCLFAKRVFIMFGGRGLLRRLRNLGFRTFHGDIIDERYDDEPDNSKRYALAWQQIVKLQHTDGPRRVYDHFKEVLEHNHQMMLALPKQQLKNIQQFIHAPFALEQTKI
jgi:hypothetical protein